MKLLRGTAGLLLLNASIAGAVPPASSAVDAGAATPIEAHGDVHGVNVIVRASSMLADPKRPDHYSPVNLLDLDDSTVWAEGVPGNGEGQWVELELPPQPRVGGFELALGHGKSAALYSDNVRPRRVEVTLQCEGFQCGDFNFEVPKDQPFGGWFILWEPYMMSPLRVRLTVKSVWPGTRYADMCIARFRPIFKQKGGDFSKPLLGEGAELGPSIVAMLHNMKTPSRFCAKGTYTERTYESLEWKKVSAKPDDVDHRRDGPDPKYWDCTAAAYIKGWDEGGDWVAEVEPTGSDTATMSFIPLSTGKAPRPLRAYWERTANGWKVRGLDLQERTDDEERDCQ